MNLPLSSWGTTNAAPMPVYMSNRSRLLSLVSLDHRPSKQIMSIVERRTAIGVAERTGGKTPVEEMGMVAAVDTAAIAPDTSAVAADSPRAVTGMVNQTLEGVLIFRTLEDNCKEWETLFSQQDREDLAVQANLVEVSSQGIHDLDWYMDSGDTHHVTSDLANINIHDETPPSDHIYVGDDATPEVIAQSTSPVNSAEDALATTEPDELERAPCVLPPTQNTHRMTTHIHVPPNVLNSLPSTSNPLTDAAPEVIAQSTGPVDSAEDALATTEPDEPERAPCVLPPTQNTHRMVTRAKDGSLPSPRFVIPRHPTAFSVSTALQEPHSFAQARMEAKSDSTGLYLTQSKYIHDILIRTSMLDCKPISSPVSAGSRLSLHDGHPFEDPSLYRSVVGSLQYLSLTRPDIAYAVNQVCQFMHNPSVTHWLAVKRILRYLKGTITYGLHLRPGSISALHGYSDADWAGNSDDRRSVSGFIIFLGSNPISWSSKKQRTVARSSTESEYKSLANATVKIIWLWSLLQELGFSQHQTPILCLLTVLPRVYLLHAFLLCGPSFTWQSPR
ncbi:hypothetical protein CRG98_001381 [Punica granatum]|uniref:Reverse transcriptase Ty1/copia-type domain-containing protein n=1 Tax=Punica granatum TaxID=22663 RepID=A0A2I0LBZ3_PUNGR|nr:hypothetical protein CRG98_001381 [Punica granatum]